MSEERFPLRLRSLVGRRCRYLGRSWRVAEVLVNESKLILEEEGGDPPIQQDQYQRPLRRAAQTLEIALGNASAQEIPGECLDILEAIAAHRAP